LSDLSLFTNELDRLGLGYEVREGDVYIKIGHAKTDFVGLNSIRFIFNNGVFEMLQVEE